MRLTAHKALWVIWIAIMVLTFLFNHEVVHVKGAEARPAPATPTALTTTCIPRPLNHRSFSYIEWHQYLASAYTIQVDGQDRYTGCAVSLDWLDCRVAYSFGWSIHITWCGQYRKSSTLLEVGYNFEACLVASWFPLCVSGWDRTGLNGWGVMVYHHRAFPIP